MERDFAVRFTDESYLSKDEVKRSLSMSSIDPIWDRINTYRNFFRKTLDLSSIENRAFSVCLNSPLQMRIQKIEKRFVKYILNFSKLNDLSLNEIIDKSLFVIGKSYADVNSLTISDDTLTSIISGSVNDVPQAYLTLKNYILTLKHFLKRSSSKYDISILTSFYGKILRKDIDYNDFESFCRMIDYNNPADHVVFGRHYNAAPLDKLESLLNDVFIFNDNQQFYSLLKAIITYFYLLYIKPFDYFNEECALLSLKYIIANDDLDYIPYLLNLENRLLNVNDDLFNSKFVLSELSFDITYFINYILDIIEEALEEFNEIIASNEINVILSEFKQLDNKDNIVHPQIPVRHEVNKILPVVFEQKVSMPTMPTGLDASDVELIANNLVELYPSLKYNQAKFYAGHCTIGKYYSIAQYKKETGVAYETARTSMENLVNLGFYKKEQIKNKFVYTPVVR